MSDWQYTWRSDSISTLEWLQAYVAERWGEAVAETEMVPKYRPIFMNTHFDHPS